MAGDDVKNLAQLRQGDVVTIAAIDPALPSVTFAEPGGTTQTIKVRHPEKLQGVNEGDMVELTDTEALLLKVEAAAKQ